MKKIKNILVASILTVSAFTATIMTSCNPDACKDVVCANGGTCTDGSCSCASGYEGTECNTQSLTKVLGTNNASVNYNFSDNAGGTCGNYTGTFTASRSSADTTMLILTNLGGFGLTTSVKATVDKNTLTIPSQAVTGSTSNTISGNGTYSNGTITGTYTNNDGTSTCSYNFTWTKQ